MVETLRPLIALLAASALAGGAGAASSENYTASSQAVDSAGGNASGGPYSQIGSAGTLSGLATTPSSLARHGFAGQLMEPIALQLSATPASVAEGSSIPVSATLLNDDTSTTSLPSDQVTWQAESGPVALITGGGVVHTTAVYQPTPARIAGTLGDFNATLDLTVLDTVPDNYKTYAGDGLGDLWQVTYFGENNPLAAPGVDASGVGYDNRFKYAAGLNPVDRNAPNGRFHFSIELVPGQPASRRIVFRPRYADRNYAVLYSDDLSTWHPIAAPVVNDSGETRRVTDTSATGTRRFYKVDVTLP